MLLQRSLPSHTPVSVTCGASESSSSSYWLLAKQTQQTIRQSKFTVYSWLRMHICVHVLVSWDWTAIWLCWSIHAKTYLFLLEHQSAERWWHPCNPKLERSKYESLLVDMHMAHVLYPSHLQVGYMPFAGSDERKQIHMIRSGTYLVKKERWAKVSPGRSTLWPFCLAIGYKRTNSELQDRFSMTLWTGAFFLYFVFASSWALVDCSFNSKIIKQTKPFKDAWECTHKWLIVRHLSSFLMYPLRFQILGFLSSCIFQTFWTLFDLPLRMDQVVLSFWLCEEFVGGGSWSTHDCARSTGTSLDQKSELLQRKHRWRSGFLCGK